MIYLFIYLSIYLFFSFFFAVFVFLASLIVCVLFALSVSANTNKSLELFQFQTIISFV